MVPSEPFALHILSLQVQFDEAVPLSQRLLQFAPRDEAAGKSCVHIHCVLEFRVPFPGNQRRSGCG
eukprot:1708465-Pyramimonas_sp.AAC.1